MLKTLTGLLKRKDTIRVFLRKNENETMVVCKDGDNLMDATNQFGNAEARIFGICNKELACRTCAVDIQSHNQYLPEPTDDETDVLIESKRYIEGVTRMSCQITITPQLDGMIIRIVDSSE